MSQPVVAERAGGLHPVRHGGARQPLSAQVARQRGDRRRRRTRAGCDLGGFPDDHARRDDRERCPGRDRRRPRRRALDRAVGRRRIHRRIRVAASSRRLAGRPNRRSQRLRRRAGRVRPGQRSVCRRKLGRVPDRGSSRAGHRCRLADALLARLDRPHLRRAAGAPPCACRLGRRVRSRSRKRSGRRRASSSRRSAGAPSSSPTCLSGSRPRGFSCCTRTRRHAGADRSICPARSSRCVSLAALTAGFISAGAHGWAARVTLALVISGGLALGGIRPSRTDGTPTADRPGHLPERDLHDGGRDRLPVQLLSLREHLLPGRRSASGCASWTRWRRASPCFR